MPNSKLETDNDWFHNCTELENALITLFGHKSRWEDSASSFEVDGEKVRRALLAAVIKIEKHVNLSITGDDRLREMLCLNLGLVRQHVLKICDDPHLQLNIIGNLLEIVVRLLGYERGAINRQTIFFQNQNQLQSDLDWETGIGFKNRGIEEILRYEMICRLRERNTPIKQIAIVLNISESKVRIYLRDAVHYERMKLMQDFTAVEIK